MKDFDELVIPSGYRFSDDHEWAKAGGDVIRVGISDYAQGQLGDIVYVELPQIGDSFNSNDEFGVVESVKAVSALLIPVSGKITAVNTELDEAPNYVNESPYERGWMLEIKPNSNDYDHLMNTEEYMAFLKGEK